VRHAKATGPPTKRKGTYRARSRSSCADQYQPALAALDAHADLLPAPKVTAEIAASVFDKWSDALRQKADWQGAVDIYDRGLQLYPKDRHLGGHAQVLGRIHAPI
jgi:hypothetical protein